MFEGCKVLAIRWVDELFPAQIKQLPAGDVCNVRSEVFMEEENGAVVRPLPLYMTCQTSQLLAVKLCSGAGVE